MNRSGAEQNPPSIILDLSRGQARYADLTPGETLTIHARDAGSGNDAPFRLEVLGSRPDEWASPPVFRILDAGFTFVTVPRQEPRKARAGGRAGARRDVGPAAPGTCRTREHGRHRHRPRLLARFRRRLDGHLRRGGGAAYRAHPPAARLVAPPPADELRALIERVGRAKAERIAALDARGVRLARPLAVMTVSGSTYRLGPADMKGRRRLEGPKHGFDGWLDFLYAGQRMRFTSASTGETLYTSPIVTIDPDPDTEC